MTNFSEIGINWSVFNTFQDISFENVTNMTQEELINHIPENANLMTNGYYGVIVLFGMLIYLLWLLHDQSQYGQFKYNGLRSLGISLGIVTTFGIMMLNTGFITNFIHVSMLLGLYMLILIYTILNNSD